LLHAWGRTVLKSNTQGFDSELVRRVFIYLAVASLAVLGWFSVHLAGNRIFQVDECGNVWAARMLATGDRGELGAVDLLQLAVSLVARGASHSIELFVSGRFVMLEVFWVNILLIALATGEKLLSRRGLVALLGAATLAPMWDYGFEIRHDNLLLTGLLLMWCVGRVRPSGLQSYLIVGGLLVAMQFVAFKAFVYTVPISCALLAFPPLREAVPRWKLALAWAAGAAVAFVILRAGYGWAGVWQSYTHGSQWLLGKSVTQFRFGPALALGRLPAQTPLLLAMVGAAVVGLGIELRRAMASQGASLSENSISGNQNAESSFPSRSDLLERVRTRLHHAWKGNLPEGLLLGCAFGGLLLNPTPYPYNLVLLAPFAFIFAFRYAASLLESSNWTPFAPVIAGVVVCAHLVPFATATLRHLDWTNYRQERLMRVAEALTDPNQDPVCDGIWMVPTRPIVDRRTWLHSMTLQGFIDGSGPRFRDFLAARPPAVFIPSYRTDALPEADHAFIRERYVPLADDCWVLGKVLPGGGGEFEIVRPGRYRISSLAGSDLAGTYPQNLEALLAPEPAGTIEGTLDGQALTECAQLSAGSHRLECPTGTQPAIVWLGPQLQRIHRLGPGDHRMLFVNWY
jgi:hypothetical protein